MPQLIWRVEGVDKKIFLTFDDGPIPDVTPMVVDYLHQYKARASFFCVGENIIKHPEIFELLKSQNHFLASHTYNHLSGWSSGNLSYFKNVEKAAKLVPSNYFRPPYGRITPLQYKVLKNKYKIVMWDVLSGDFDPYIHPQTCFENVIRNARSGSIIVLHDSLKAKKNVAYCLPKILDYYSQKGFSFECFDGL